MTLDQSPTTAATPTSHPLARTILVAILAVAALMVLTAIVGVSGSGPSLDLVGDPAGTLPF